MSEVATAVAALRFELEQVKDHPLQEFRDRAKEIEAEIAEWEHPSPAAAPTAEEIAAAEAAKAAEDEAAAAAAEAAKNSKA